MEIEPISEPTARAIKLTRRLTRRLAEQIARHDVPAADILIGIQFGLHDMVERELGPGGSFEWQRSAIDLLERAHLNGDRAPDVD